MYLVDTDWIVDYLKGKEDIVKRLQTLFDKGLYVSIISVAEIYEGIAGTKNKEVFTKSFEDFLEGVIVLNLSNDICKKFGEIRNILRKKGELIGDFDILIASTSMVHDLKLITNNTAHFSRIKELEMLKN
ncbi:MAG: type II toxin-antitoxin system VapC family toxin [Candidatus Aenigmatarchaeota archaeon]